MTRPHPLRAACAASAFVFATASCTARADTPDDPRQAAFGIAAVAAPRYAGSSSERVQFLPMVSIQHGPWFIDTLRGIGAQYQTSSGFSISQAVHYDFGRLDRDSTIRPGSRTLAGMGAVPGSVVSRTTIAQRFGPVVSASAEAEFSLKEGTYRGRYRAGVELTLIERETDVLTFNADLHGGNAAFNRAYFGVTPRQSARTRFAPYVADAGLYAYSGSLTWTHVFSPHWSSNVLLRGMRYVDQADGSPVVRQRTSISTAVAVNYLL